MMVRFAAYLAAGFLVCGALLFATVALAQTGGCAPPRRCAYVAVLINGAPQPVAGVVNGNFEAGPAAWVEQTTQGRTLIADTSAIPGAIEPRGGEYAAWLGGAPSETTLLAQHVTVPPDAPFLGYWYRVNSSDDDCSFDSDIAEVAVDTTLDDSYADATPLGQARILCEKRNTPEWVKTSADLRAYAGQTIAIVFRVRLDAARNSNFFIDDVGFQGRPS